MSDPSISSTNPNHISAIQRGMVIRHRGSGETYAVLDTHFNEATAVATARVELPDMSILRIGTLVRDDQGSAWVVIAILEDHAIAIKNVLISNPPEWEIVGEQKVIDASEENFIRLAKPFGWRIVSRAVE